MSRTARSDGWRRVARGARLLLVATLGTTMGISCSTAAPGPAGQTVSCTATGGELLVPPMADEAACTRFVGALDAALAAGGGASVAGRGLRLELGFSRAGIASAIVTPAGSPTFDLNIAQSDRPLGADVLDRLAAATAQRLLAAPK